MTSSIAPSSRNSTRLDELLRGISAVGELSPRTSDYVVSYGERLSSKMCAAAFAVMGVNSALVDAREVHDHRRHSTPGPFPMSRRSTPALRPSWLPCWTPDACP